MCSEKLDFEQCVEEEKSEKKCLKFYHAIRVHNGAFNGRVKV